MGRDKARLLVDGQPLARRGARLLRKVCDGALEVGPGHSDLPSVLEVPRGGGPAAALVAGAQALATDRFLLLAVDLPRATEALLRLIARWPGRPTAVPVVGDRLQPVCARYGGDAVAIASELRVGNPRGPSLHAVLDGVEHDRLTSRDWGPVVSAGAFEDLDTPADLRRYGPAAP